MAKSSLIFLVSALLLISPLRVTADAISDVLGVQSSSKNLENLFEGNPSRPDMPGKFAVGSETGVVFGRTTEVWYPSTLQRIDNVNDKPDMCVSDVIPGCIKPGFALDKSVTPPAHVAPHVYNFDQFLNASMKTLINNQPLPFTCDCYRNAAPAAGPFPVVIFTHGTSQTRFSPLDWAPRLASRGFIVISADDPFTNFEAIGMDPSLTEDVPGYLFSIGGPGFIEAVVFGSAAWISTSCQSIGSGSGLPGLSLPEDMYSVDTAFVGHSLGTVSTSVAAAALPVAAKSIVLTGNVDTFPINLPMTVNQRVWLQGEDDTVPLGGLPSIKASYNFSPPSKRWWPIHAAGHMFTTTLCSPDMQRNLQVLRNGGVSISAFWETFIGRECTNSSAIAYGRGVDLSRYLITAGVEEGFPARCSKKLLRASTRAELVFPEITNAEASPVPQSCP